MTTICFKLDIDDEIDEKHWFRVNVEIGMKGTVRMNVQVAEFDSDEALNSQGIDLSPAECRAVANMLCTAADIREQEDSKDVINFHRE